MGQKGLVNKRRWMNGRGEGEGKVGDVRCRVYIVYSPRTAGGV